MMKPSEIYKENADNCATLAEGEPSKNSPAYKLRIPGIAARDSD
jgi:hypothetical protein